jgi:hypothetical protein
MYIVVAIFAALFAVSPTAKTANTVAPAAVQTQAAPSAVKEAPVLIDSRFSKNGSLMPWEKNADLSEFLPSNRTC